MLNQRPSSREGRRRCHGLRFLAPLLAMAVGTALVQPGCAGSAEVVFGVTSELSPGASFTSMDARVTVDGEEVLARSFEGGQLSFPMELAVPNIDDGALVVVELQAMQGTVAIVSRTASTSGVDGRKLLHEVQLESECVAIDCAEGTTCQEGECVDPFVEPADLPDYYPKWAGEAGGDICSPGGEPQVLVGEGQTDYHAIDDLDVLQVEAGPQGGFHVWVAARLKNLHQSGSITAISGRFPELDYEPPPMSLVFTFDPDEGDYCKVYGLRFRLDDPDHPIETLLGQMLELTVEITDSDGKKASSTRSVKMSDDYLEG